MGILSALSYGGIVAVIGLFIVFLGLTILIASVYIMAAVFKRINAARTAKRTAAQAPAPAPVPAPVAAPEPAAEEEEVTDPELIAVIAAAIAAFDSSNKSLVVRRVRKASGWNRTARAEQVYRF